MKTFTLAELERMLEIAPGKRVQFHPQYCQEAVGTDRRNFDTSHDLSVIRPDGTRVKLAQYKHADEALLSQMAPDLAQQLHAALVREQEGDAEVAKLREAVEWYANPANWCDSTDWDGPDTSTPNAVPFRIEEELGPMVCDCGDTARAALSQIEAPKGGE